MKPRDIYNELTRKNLKWLHTDEPLGRRIAQKQRGKHGKADRFLQVS